MIMISSNLVVIFFCIAIAAGFIRNLSIRKQSFVTPFMILSN